LIGGAFAGVGLATAGAAITGTVGSALIGAAAAVGGFLGLATPVGPVAGGILGAFKGTSKVGAENAAAQRAIAIHAGAAQHRQAAVAQDAYMTGVQTGRAEVMQKLQEYHAHMVEQQMIAEAQKNPAGIGPQTAKIRQQQAAAAGASIA
jgi:hypothetical protein